MTQQTATNRWGVILGWIRRDGMARMRVTGVVPTPLIVDCELHFMGFASELLWDDEILTQLLSEQCDN